MSSSSQISALRQLANIINEAVDSIEATYAKAGAPLPSLDAPTFNPTDPAEALLQDPVVDSAALNIMAAASQLSATVCSPVASALNASQAFHISSCLRVASELNVVELLREAGPEGLHAKDIAAPSKTNAALLARILRLLATHNIFREVKPNVFANNRISAVLDKGKPSSVLFEKRAERLVGTSGVTALVEFFSEDIFKSAAVLGDTLLDPKEGELPYNRAFNTDQALYYWMQRPENALRLQRFGLGMAGTAGTEPVDAIFTGFDWSALPDKGVVVDVGGGIGNTALIIAQKNPKLRVVVQDLEHQVAEAKTHWEQNFPEHVKNQMVEFQSLDFFNPQPVKNASVFMLRYIMHNWDDARAAKILRRLREVAEPTTQLVVIEKILSVASTIQSADETAIPGAARPSAPAPLLPNWGVGKAEFYFHDMAVHTMLGGGERTLGGYVDVFAQGGWKLVKVCHCKGSQLSHIVGVPA
ncbi:O-methyltransferase-domain-containing protein [Favolaschia claudopus]|uniref:O-methyltransferase-domain-containing protein n=1 Tax=Favolaschia claudopus TaxID=2862362 RepID=A0AAV9ZG14_9AGAR